jgi:hypothetical protein
MSFLICPREGELMSSSGKAGNGRGNSRKKNHRRRSHENGNWQSAAPGRVNNYSQEENPGKNDAQNHLTKRNTENGRRERASFIERPKWNPPKTNADPMPVSICPWCGKPIRDMFSAIADKDSGVPVHFDCVSTRIAFGEKLEKGETVAYIGGGRFGIISFGGKTGAPQETRQDRNSPQAGRDFTIRKIIEWEKMDKRAEWRSLICEHYSVT